MNETAVGLFDNLFARRPEMQDCRAALEAAQDLLTKCFHSGGKALICGNGGSAADSEHIVGELVKGFRSKRPLPAAERKKIESSFPEEGSKLADRLQGSLPAISLVSQVSLCSAITNDVSAEMVFAQQVYGYGKSGDVLIGISTSGNATNVINAVKVARAFGLGTVVLTGPGGTLKELSEIAITVPGGETSEIQERHMAVYHTLCAALEAEFFSI